MTTHELAKLLLTKPNVRVLIKGYEYGFEDIKEENMHITRMAIDANAGESYCGPHDHTAYPDHDNVEDCLLIERES